MRHKLYLDKPTQVGVNRIELPKVLAEYYKDSATVYIDKIEKPSKFSGIDLFENWGSEDFFAWNITNSPIIQTSTYFSEGRACFLSQYEGIYRIGYNKDTLYDVSFYIHIDDVETRYFFVKIYAENGSEAFRFRIENLACQTYYGYPFSYYYTFGSMSTNTWNKIGFIFNWDAGNVDCYINDIFQATKPLLNNVEPYKIEFAPQYDQYFYTETYLDNIKIMSNDTRYAYFTSETETRETEVGYGNLYLSDVSSAKENNVIHYEPSGYDSKHTLTRIPSIINYTSLERRVKIYLKDLAISGRIFKGNADLLSIIQEILEAEELKRLKLVQNTDTDLLLSVLYNGDINKKYTNKYKGNEDILSLIKLALDTNNKNQDSDFEELFSIIDYLRIELLKKKKLYGSKASSEDLLNLILLNSHDKENLDKRLDNDNDDVIHIIDENIKYLNGYKKNYDYQAPSEDFLIHTIIDKINITDKFIDNDFEELLLTIPIPELVNYVLDVDAFSSYIIDLEVYNEPQNYVLDLEVI